MKKITHLKYLCIVFGLFLSLMPNRAQAQTPEYTFVNGTGSNSIPWGGGGWGDQRNQWLYLPGDFGPTVPSGFAISTIYVHSSRTSPVTTYTNFEVSIGQNASTTSLSTTWETGLTQVLSPRTFVVGATVTNDWIEIELDTPIPYDPSEPLIVEFIQTATAGNIGLWSGGDPVNPIYVNSNTQTYGASTATTGNTRAYSYHFGIDLIPLAPDDASLASVDSPRVFCAGIHNTVVTVANTGINQLDSVDVHWEVNNIAQPSVHYVGLLDTNKGNFPSSVQLVLGSVAFTSGNNSVKAWTSAPNGLQDTINFNDTADVIVHSAAAPLAIIY